jgi:hypothetical protein
MIKSLKKLCPREVDILFKIKIQIEEIGQIPIYILSFF